MKAVEYISIADDYSISKGPIRRILGRDPREGAGIMFVGVGPEAGKRVRETDAFSYACERCLTGSREERQAFLGLAAESSDMLDFAVALMEWFYSGNWINDTAGGKDRVHHPV
ncbi:MAG: hypothetical protein ACLVJO_10445 [[Clostridium] scindens]